MTLVQAGAKNFRLTLDFFCLLSVRGSWDTNPWFMRK